MKSNFVLSIIVKRELKWGDIASLLYFEKIPSENKMQGDTLAIEYLKNIIEECYAQGIEVLLTCIYCFTIKIKNI